MCFGSSKAKEVKAPPPTPPTTFDYGSVQRGDGASQQKQAAVAAPTQSFGAELGAPKATGAM